MCVCVLLCAILRRVHLQKRCSVLSDGKGAGVEDTNWEVAEGIIDNIMACGGRRRLRTCSQVLPAPLCLYMAHSVRRICDGEPHVVDARFELWA